MTELFFCTVSAVDYDHASADIAIQDREDMVKTDVPVLDSVYNMPKTGETVAALFNVENGQLQRGVILGRPYHRTDVMEVSAQTVRVSSLEADAGISAQTVAAKQVTADSITYRDSCEKG